jgi:DNA-binding SARP family transcriptional activator
MEHPKRLLTKDDIKENIIAADKRKTISKATISKYVSSLRNSLKVHFKKDVIFSQKQEGWYLDVTKT